MIGQTRSVDFRILPLINWKGVALVNTVRHAYQAKMFKLILY